VQEGEEDVPFFKADSTPRPGDSNQWKAKNGLYVAGLSKRGIHGCATDAELIAEDICNEYLKHTAEIYKK
jgi:indole-3-pyruvate monooxygenase